MVARGAARGKVKVKVKAEVRVAARVEWAVAEQALEVSAFVPRAEQEFPTSAVCLA